MYMISISYLAADTISSDNSYTVFKVLMLNVAMSTMVLPVSNFDLGLISVAGFSNTGARAPNSVECALCLPTWRAMRFGYSLN